MSAQLHRRILDLQQELRAARQELFTVVAAATGADVGNRRVLYVRRKDAENLLKYELYKEVDHESDSLTYRLVDKRIPELAAAVNGS